MEEREAKRIEREETEARLRGARERLARLRGEVAAYGKDLGAIDRALVAAAERMQGVEAKVSETEARLAELAADREGLLASLRERRGELASVLAILQRMGRQPPPALLIAPRDALSAVRTSLLLGSALPALQSRTGTLRTEIALLAETGREIEVQRERLRADLDRLAEDETRLTLLLDEKKGLLDRSRKDLASEERAIEQLANEARSLDALLLALDARIADAEAAARKAAEADAARIAAGEARLKEARDRLARAGKSPKTDAAPVPTVAAGAPFAGRKGTLPLPVAGLQLWSFGTVDAATGSSARNVGFATRANARVRAPAAGVVRYAGPFRSFGHVLILDAGDGYQIVLTGLARTDVPAGRSVLAGEPVGRMGATRVAALASVALGGDRPVLYVAFRHKGEPIDPGPWWADGAGRETRDAS